MQDNATPEPIIGSNYDAMLQGYGVWDRSNYADHMFTEWSDDQLNRLLFIQVATGSTGDEAPYKGTAILEPGVEPGSKHDYSLDDKHQKWNKYRRKIFQAYADEFQKPKRKKSIALMKSIIYLG